MNQEEAWLAVGERLNHIKDSVSDVRLDNSNTQMEIFETQKDVAKLQDKLTALASGQGLLILLVITDIVIRGFSWAMNFSCS